MAYIKTIQILKNKLPYDFVDATVLKLDVSKGTKLKIKVQLYKMFNPNEEVVQLTFNGVNETQRIFNLSKSLHLLRQSSEDLIPKVNNISFDAITEPTEGFNNFYIEIDGVKGEKISCKEYNIKLVEPNQK